MNRISALMATYGWIAIGVYLATGLVVFLGSVAAISAGLQPEGVGEQAGTYAAAWAMMKLATPGRVAVTVLLTPLVSRLLGRRLTPAPVALAATEGPAASTRET